MFHSDATTDHRLKQDSGIWKGPKFTTPEAPQAGYENPRAPIDETATRGAPPDSETGASLRCRRRGGDSLPIARRKPPQNQQQRGRGTGDIFSDEEGGFWAKFTLLVNLPTPQLGVNPHRGRGRSWLPKFLDRPEIRSPRAAVSREVDYVATPRNRGHKDYLGNSADSAVDMADCEGGLVGLKTNRVKELTAFVLVGFGGRQTSNFHGRLWLGSVRLPFTYIA